MSKKDQKITVKVPKKVMGKIEIIFELRKEGIQILKSYIPTNQELAINVLSGALVDVCDSFSKKHKKDEPDCDCVSSRFSEQIAVALRVIHKKLSKEATLQKKKKSA